MNKIKTLANLQEIILKLKNQGKQIVFTNGCFDILHLGHLKILKEAKKKGDILIVGVNSDFSIKKIKGKKRPILNEKTRTHILESIEFVDYVILFKEETPYKLIKTLKPDILVKGGDWIESEIIGGEFVKKVCRVKIYPGYSTTDIIDRIKKSA